jgi:hypothetical protein
MVMHLPTAPGGEGEAVCGRTTGQSWSGISEELLRARQRVLGPPLGRKEGVMVMGLGEGGGDAAEWPKRLSTAG